MTVTTWTLTGDVSTMVGNMSRRIPKTSSGRSAQSVASATVSPVTAALVRSVTWTWPPVSTQATQLSTVPMHRSRERSGS